MVPTSSNEVSCHVLADKLRNYATTVSSKGSKDIDNYSKSSLTLASHSKRESEQWKCYLKDPDCVFNNLVKPSSCQLYDEKTLCHSYQIVQKDVATLCNTKHKRQIGEPFKEESLLSPETEKSLSDPPEKSLSLEAY
ncbi:unnamed protein product [Timema podura]|uniref:Uncharacterized protein n=1 Tax=Timema podura TaxID=61482 RepID=A0ABN7NM92_TIMPD|nr:unnamed protein product [Timema podura]